MRPYIVHNIDGQTSIMFPAKPSAAVRCILKAFAFQWSAALRSWLRRGAIVQDVIAALDRQLDAERQAASDRTDRKFEDACRAACRL